MSSNKPQKNIPHSFPSPVCLPSSSRCSVLASRGDLSFRFNKHTHTHTHTMLVSEKHISIEERFLDVLAWEMFFHPTTSK